MSPLLTVFPINDFLDLDNTVLAPTSAHHSVCLKPWVLLSHSVVCIHSKLLFCSVLFLKERNVHLALLNTITGHPCMNENKLRPRLETNFDWIWILKMCRTVFDWEEVNSFCAEWSWSAAPQMLEGYMWAQRIRFMPVELSVTLTISSCRC